MLITKYVFSMHIMVHAYAVFIPQLISTTCILKFNQFGDYWFPWVNMLLSIMMPSCDIYIVLENVIDFNCQMKITHFSVRSTSKSLCLGSSLGRN